MKGKNFKQRLIGFILVFIMIVCLIPNMGSTAITQDLYSPVVTQTFNGHTYGVYDVGLTWTEAKTYCESLGGHLATITSQEEQDFIFSLLTNVSRPYYFLGGCKEDNSMKWITGEPFTYTNWAPGEPNNIRGQEFYLMIYTGNDAENNYTPGMWNDAGDNTIYGADNYGFICEWEINEKISKFIEIAKDQVGNGNKYNSDGAAWCADFVLWCAKQAEIPMVSSESEINSTPFVYKSRYCPTIYSWYSKQGRIHSEPKPGALVLFWFEDYSDNTTYYGHIGIVVGVENDKINVVHGNWSKKVSNNWWNKDIGSLCYTGKDYKMFIGGYAYID